MRAPAILVFDSGVGGLTVFREIARARPDARLTYVADDALFPYGKVAEDALVAQLTDSGLVKNVADIYKLSKDNLLSLEKVRLQITLVGSDGAILDEVTR